VTDSYPDWPFYDSGLLDELFVQLGSVTLAGGGKPLLPRSITREWQASSRP